MRTDDTNSTQTLLDCIELDAQIPDKVSLKRIRRRVLSEISPQHMRNSFKTAVMIPAILLILLGTISVYAYTNNLWDLFFSSSSVSESIDEKTFSEMIVTSNGYKITLHDTALDKNSGLILLSLERTDHAVLDRNTLLDIDIPLSGYGSFGSSSDRTLSQDGKTMYYCYSLKSSRDLTAEKLKLIVRSIDTNLTSIITSDVSFNELCSDRYSDILPLKESSTDGAFKSVDNAKGAQLVTAGYTSEKFCVVYKLLEQSSNDHYSIWLSGLTDSRTGEFCVAKGHGSLDFPDETGTFEYALFNNYKIEDLEFLFPTFTLIESTGRVEGDWSFEIESFSELQTIYTSDGLNASAINGIQIEKLTISPIGTYLWISGESSRLYDELMLNCSESNSYLLMEDGSKIPLRRSSSGGSQSAEGAFNLDLFFKVNENYNGDIMVQPMLTDTKKVKTVYFLDTPIWERP